jgi:ornithine carbamoyltransferase
MFQLGGCTIFLGPDEINLGVRETPADCARNLSRWVDLIVVRTFAHGTVEEMARHATVPVINGLTDLFHPCQVLADCFTLLEHRGKLDGLKIAFLGDGNNMVHSWIEAAEKYKFSFALACPAGYEPDGEILKRARGRGAKVIVTHDAGEAARGAHVMYTDVWTSMGQEAEADRRRKAFRDYQLNHEILALADPAALVMHCLPAHRGEEITDEVLDGPQSIVLEQAENRMHVQKAIMVWLLREFRRAKTPGSQASSSSRIKRSKGRKG